MKHLPLIICLAAGGYLLPVPFGTVEPTTPHFIAAVILVVTVAIWTQRAKGDHDTRHRHQWSISQAQLRQARHEAETERLLRRAMRGVKPL